MVELMKPALLCPQGLHASLHTRSWKSLRLRGKLLSDPASISPSGDRKTRKAKRGADAHRVKETAHEGSFGEQTAVNHPEPPSWANRRDGAALTRPCSPNEVQDEEDDGDHDDNVNKTARDVKHEKPKQPRHEQDDRKNE
jgi:hypothetical protein